MKEWYYDEFKQVGINFESVEEVQAYDEKYKKSRDLKAELDFISKAIDLKPNSIVLEIGTGTAELAIGLAKSCKKVVATDVSETMLSYSQEKAINQSITNIEFKRSGFLITEFAPESFDAVVSQLCMHHLPDFWKLVAINNIFKALKSGGKFYLLDTIITVDLNNYEEEINNHIITAKEKVNEKMANEIIVNIRDEYPTYDWIIEKMLLKSGFKVDNKIRYNGLLTVFVCTKE